MTDEVTTATKPITRNKLSQWLPNHEAVKALENLTQDVGTTLPNVMNAANAQITALRSQVEVLKSNVATLQDRVTALESDVAELQAEVAALTGGGNDAAIGQIRAQLSILNGLIDARYKGPKP